MEGVKEGTNKRKILEREDGNSPDREGNDACIQVKRLIKGMKDNEMANDREDREVREKDVERKKPHGNKDGELNREDLEVKKSQGEDSKMRGTNIKLNSLLDAVEARTTKNMKV